LSILHDLRTAETRYDVAALLGYKPSGLSYIVFQIPKAEKYKTFKVQKKGGGERLINAPISMLKGLQRRLADVLCECLRELEGREKRKNKLSHAFRKDYSIITNAKAHTSRRYVLNVDLQDFFPSLHFGRVRGFFLKGTSNNDDFVVRYPATVA
jgi:RNA-directed DNA polymerase